MSCIAPVKRSRPIDLDEEDECMSEHVVKKQCSLPLRISPSSSPRKDHLTPQSLQRGPYTVPPTLTPAESSDEDVGDDRRSKDHAALNVSQPGGTSSFPTISDDVPNTGPFEMTDMPPPSIDPWRKPVLARRRANGISSSAAPMPIKFSTDASQTDANGGRIPTPIYGHFASTDVNMDTSEAAMNSFLHPGARFQLRYNNQQNVLSPMMSEDGESEAEWWRRRRLPTPANSPTIFQSMEMDDVTSPGIDTMELLSFDNVRTNNSHMNHDAPDGALDGDPLARQAPTPSSTRSSNNKGHAMFERQSPSTTPQSRKGKLVMGFRTDCEKCQKRAPGHYSHIVWS